MSTIDEKFAPTLGLDGVWRFGAALAHGGLALPGGATQYISAVVTAPPGVSLQKLVEQSGKARNVVWPVLWDPAYSDEDGCCAAPVILRLSVEQDARMPALTALHDLADGLLADAFPSFRDFSGEPPGYSVRVDGPISAQTISSRTSSLSAPAWEPDAELQSALGADAPLAVVAVIDDGLPFAHRCVRDSIGRKSRMEFCWLQGAAAPPATESPSAVAAGREYLRHDIDALIESYGDDEDRLYREAGALEPVYEYGASLNGFSTHGAHALGRAAGFKVDDPTSADMRDRLRVIGVQLAPPVTLDTTGQSKQGLILQAFNYVFERAERIRLGYGCAQMPLVINFSYGYTGGPHDGSGFLADAIRRLVMSRVNKGQPTIVTLPAGNSFQSRLCGQLTANSFRFGRATFSMFVPPADRSGSVLQLWFPAGSDLSTLGVEIEDPSGFMALSIARGDCQDMRRLFDIKDRRGADVGRLDGDGAGGRRCIVVRLLPSEPIDGGAAHARAGSWRITLDIDTPARLGGAVDCRILRDTDPIGFRRGARQSYFDCDEPVRGNSGTWLETDDPEKFLRRFGTLNDLASADHTLLVAGCYEGSGEPAPYSSAGLINRTSQDGQPLAIRCAAPTETSRALPGVLGDGARSGSVVRLSGTSVASPLVARELALAMLARAKKAANGKSPPPISATPPSDRLGSVPFDEVRGVMRRIGGNSQTKARLGDFLFETNRMEDGASVT